jgi:response regulator of citrate/malate metabolism
VISQEEDLEVCSEAEDAVIASKLIGQLQPDLAIVVDITLKDTYRIELVPLRNQRLRGRLSLARALVEPATMTKMVASFARL